MHEGVEHPLAGLLGVLVFWDSMKRSTSSLILVLETIMKFHCKIKKNTDINPFLKEPQEQPGFHKVLVFWKLATVLYSKVLLLASLLSEDILV